MGVTIYEPKELLKIIRKRKTLPFLLILSGGHCTGKTEFLKNFVHREKARVINIDGIRLGGSKPSELPTVFKSNSEIACIYHREELTKRKLTHLTNTVLMPVVSCREYYSDEINSYTNRAIYVIETTLKVDVDDKDFSDLQLKYKNQIMVLRFTEVTKK